MTDENKYVLDRVFKAPRKLVWRAWTDPKLLHQWYGPGADTTIHQYDLKPGGVWLNEMRWGDKADYSKMLFQQVLEPEKIVWHHCSTDADWNVSSNQMMPDWPRVLLTTVTFTEVSSDEGQQTNVRLTQIPLDATEAENACFAQMMAGMSKGWGSGYAIMDDLLASLQADEAEQ